jgi:hypothetical protein
MGVKAVCRKHRRLLVVFFSMKDASVHLPHTTKEHLQHCRPCRQYRDGLESARHLTIPESLYTFELKARTLRRINEVRDSPQPRFVPALALGLATIGVLSLVLPIWGLSLITSLFFESTAVSLGVSLFLVHSVAGAAAGMSAIPLATRSCASRDSQFGGFQ